MPTILFAGGGSLGHIAPSVAVWRELERKNLQLTAHFVCADRVDEHEFLQNEKLTYTVIDAPRLKWDFIFRFPKAIKQARRLLKKHDVSVVFSKGGFVSLPVALAAKRLGIPIVLHESDIVTGRANRLIARMAKVICHAFPGKDGTVCTGNPVRDRLLLGSKERGLKRANLDDAKPVLLVIGGSQGARDINTAIIKNLDQLLHDCHIIHITGRGKSADIIKPGYFSTEFALDELPDLYACADLAISRASASVLSELALNKVATIVVPLRGVAHDHQFHNAKMAADVGGCIHIEQADLASRMVPAVRGLALDKEKRNSIATQMQALVKPNAAELIAQQIMKQLESDK